MASCKWLFGLGCSMFVDLASQHGLYLSWPKGTLVSHT